VAYAVQGTPLCGRAPAALTTPLNRGSERLVVGREERAASSAGQPVLSIARTVCRPTHAGPGSGSVDGSNRPGARTGSGDPVGLLDCKGIEEGNHVPCGAVAERDEVLGAREVYVRFGDGRHVCLVELVNAMRRNG